MGINFPSLMLPLSVDPCNLDNYKELNQGDRSEKYRDASDRCDGDDLREEWHYWYVVSGNAGNALATNNAPAKGSCGTTDRLYLKGQHPLFGEGEVTRKLCIAKGNKACEQEQSIQIINCGAFYMYKLYNNGECSPPWRYCTNGVENVSCNDFNCPLGLICTLQNNGENRHCLDPNQVPETTIVQTQHETTATPKTANPTSDTTTTQLTTDTTKTKPTSDTIKAQPTTKTSTEKLTDKTTAKLKTDTTTVKPTSVTITVHLMTDTCTAKPISHTITAQPTAKTSTAKLIDTTTAKLRTDTTTAKPTSDTTTAQQTTDITTQVTRDSVSIPLQSSSSSPRSIRTSVIQQYHSAELSIPTEAKTVKRIALPKDEGVQIVVETPRPTLVDEGGVVSMDADFEQHPND
ncbi:hypothetical protein pdam_00017487 [Pocillopora damicornis]|uniref:UMOD/GP2/OIT3-like D8C domain-containing protein n=1 Tax=Pocillopora damicornis TaxID=46731 RepID=A0A3M6TUT7_POCDA|nr:hypothetical protein pdam_00017487 [Pocillopora damicornis]